MSTACRRFFVCLERVLKIILCEMHRPIFFGGKFHPNSVAAACYSALIQEISHKL